MPPGYVFIILPFYFIENDLIINLIVVSLQIICAGAIIFFLFKFCEKCFDKKVALVSALIYAILPEFIYACVSFSPTVIFHLLIVLVFYKLHVNNKTNKLNVFLSLLLAAIIYLRSEFILFALFLILVSILTKKYRQAFLHFGLILLLILPWSIRNLIVFDSLIPITTNFGQNLYRGNNPSDVGWWGEEIMVEKVNELSRDKSFEIHMNQLYLNRAINFIKENPIKFVSNGIRKQFELWIFNLSDMRTRLLIYLIPTITIFSLFIIGIIKTFNLSKYKYFFLFFLQATILSFIFFSLPRYQTMIKVLMLPFAAIGMFFLFDVFKRKDLNTKSKI